MRDAIINLLAGLATCGICGGGLIVDGSGYEDGRRIMSYICNRRRGNGSCTNRLRIPVTEMNEAVLQAIEEHALTPEAIEQVITRSERNDVAEQQATLDKEAKQVTKHIDRLVAVIADGGDAQSLVAKLRTLEARQRQIEVERKNLRPIPRLAPQVIEDRLAEWRRLLRQSTTQGRAVLQRVIRGRITFTPTFEGYTFEAPTRFDGLFAGIVVPRSAHEEKAPSTSDQKTWTMAARLTRIMGVYWTRRCPER